VAGSDEPRHRIGEGAVKQSLGEKLKKDIVAANTSEKGSGTKPILHLVGFQGEW
jgi:hypothetical protein